MSVAFWTLKLSPEVALVFVAQHLRLILVQPIERLPLWDKQKHAAPAKMVQKRHRGHVPSTGCPKSYGIICFLYISEKKQSTEIQNTSFSMSVSKVLFRH